uniref:Uncharacterized protein n=1 Tax=Anguilla anguilla TaxID=7936 RepID=A0A0E9TTW4_ANGAN
MSSCRPLLFLQSLEVKRNRFTFATHRITPPTL